jgi:hypothetical protein
LHDLLRRSEAALDSGLDQIRTTVDDLVQGSVGRLKTLLQHPRSHELDELQAQLRTLEQQLSTLLDELDERRGAARSPTPSSNGTPEGIDAAPDEPTDEKDNQASSSSA